MILDLLRFFVYLCLLMTGSHLLIKGNSAVATLLKTRVFFVSLILLGIGSSAPEFFVTITSHLHQETDIAIGNILGSNIFNILIVGALAFLSTKKISNIQSIWKSIVLLLIMTLIGGVLLWDNTLFWWKGLLFLGMFVFFFVQSKESPEEGSDLEGKSIKPAMLVFLFILGFAFLFFGAQGVLFSSLKIGEQLGLSKRLIGLFIISIGTSLPEIAIGLISLFKKKSEVALGSIIGSNVFNTFFIPSFASFIAPLSISSTLLRIDGSVVMLATSLLWVSIFLFNKVYKIFLSSIFIISYLFYSYFVLLHRVPLN